VVTLQRKMPHLKLPAYAIDHPGEDPSLQVCERIRPSQNSEAQEEKTGSCLAYITTLGILLTLAGFMSKCWDKRIALVSRSFAAWCYNNSIRFLWVATPKYWGGGAVEETPLSWI
jgi:hypothetical protein